VVFVFFRDGFYEPAEEGLRLSKISLAAWCSEVVDHLWLRLQHLDHVGGSLRLASSPALSPFRLCVADLDRTFDAAVFESMLSPIMRSWGTDSNTRAALAKTARAYLASMSSQIWFFFICRYEFFPYWFARVAVHSCPTEERRACVDTFYSHKECCLSPLFARKAALGMGLDGIGSQGEGIFRRRWPRSRNALLASRRCFRSTFALIAIA
jgi:hypothetical protein